MQKVHHVAILSLICLLILLLACSSGATTAPTASPASTAPSSPKPGSTSTSASSVSFAGKTVTLVVATAAGGGTDTTARLYGRHLRRFLPGNPTMIVKTMPGGSATIGANFAYAAKPDGLTLLVFSSNVGLPYLTQMPAAKYDLKKMEAIVGATSGGVFYSKPGLVSKPEDLPKTKGIIFGYTTGAPGWLFIAITNMMDIKPEKVVIAYDGSSASRRAFMSGELNMTFDGTDSYLQSIEALVKKGEVQPLFQTEIYDAKGNLARDPALPDLPTVKELHEKIYGKAPSGIVWDAYLAIGASRAFGNPILTPPGTPREILKAYWDAAEKIVKDSQFHKEADPIFGDKANWLVGEALSKDFKQKMVLDPKVLDWIKSTLSQYGVVFN